MSTNLLPLLSLVAIGCATPATPDDDDPGGKSDGSEIGSYVRYDGFNGIAAGATPAAPWTVVSTGGGHVAIAGVPFPADRSVELTKRNSTGTSSLSTTFTAQSGRIAFEARVMAAETAGFKAIPYIYDANGNAIASVAFQDGTIVARSETTFVPIQPFVANVWYRVRIVVDTEQGTFDLFVDGVRKQADQLLRAPADKVTNVSWFIDGANTGTLYVDNVKVYNEARYIGRAPEPIFDVRDRGAKGDGTTNDTAAIQEAIDAAAGTGGSVLLANGQYLSGTLTLRSKMTLFVDSSATLLGSTSALDYPTQTPATGNTQLHNTKRALLYAPNVTGLTIDGGGVIDGQGAAFSGPAYDAEDTRPILIWTVLSKQVTVRNLYLHKGAVWSLVSMESDNVLINNINLQSDNITHDGIDIVDGTNITIQNTAVSSGDDAMCLKTGVRRGIDTMVVKDSVFSGSGPNGGSNGIKFGTATYGAFKNVSIHDSYVKNVQYAAMAIESREGADIDGVSFQRIGFANTGTAFFIYLAQQATTHPIGDVPKLGSITNVSFTDIAGSTASWSHSPHQGSLITGHLYNGKVYPITNLTFNNVAIAFTGGSTTTPGTPVEATPGQYPESNMFGDLPAWAYYLRHVDGIRFDASTTTSLRPDTRNKLVADDVTGLVGAP